MNQFNSFRKFFILFIAATSLISCGKSDTAATATTTQSTSEVVSGTVASQTQASESASVAMVEPKKLDWLSMLLPNAVASSCGTFRSDATTCASGVSTWTISSCAPALNPTATWNGAWTFTFNNNTACTNAKTSGLPSTGANNSFTVTSAAGMTRTGAAGNYVTTDSGASGYSTTQSGGSTVTCGAVDCSTSRAVAINGIHRAFYTAAGTKVVDHTINTSTALSLSGTGANRTVTGGVIVLQHNLAKFTATATVTTALTFSAACCFPTGGTITTALSTGTTETLVYGSTCGSATLNGTAITLTHCL